MAEDDPTRQKPDDEAKQTPKPKVPEDAVKDLEITEEESEDVKGGFASKCAAQP